jgi:glycine C-acetyltransferase
VSAAQRALAERGFGMASVRFICGELQGKKGEKKPIVVFSGTQDLHKQLEQELAAFHGKEDAILFPSAFDANGGLFETLLTGEEDVVISDELNHASIIDGIRLCKATRRRYKHRDLAELEQHLAAGGRRVLVRQPSLCCFPFFSFLLLFALL